MLGMPTSMFSVSQTTITSDLIRSRWASKNFIRYFDPISSSPSTSILTLTGRALPVLR